jgi:transposase
MPVLDSLPADRSVPAEFRRMARTARAGGGPGAAAANEAAQDAAENKQRQRRETHPNSNHGALPAHLPRYEVLIDVEHRDCPCCGGAMHAIGELRSEQLDIVPAQLRVRVTRRPRYACRTCEGAVVVAPAPERPIDGGRATEALVAYVLVSKFCDSLPLYRQSQMLARQGVTLDRSTLSNWVGRACWWLTPLYDLLVSTALSAPKLFADDTTLSCLPTIPPCRCSIRAVAEPRRDGSGATQSTIGRYC